MEADFLYPCGNCRTVLGRVTEIISHFPLLFLRTILRNYLEELGYILRKFWLILLIGEFGDLEVIVTKKEGHEYKVSVYNFVPYGLYCSIAAIH